MNARPKYHRPLRHIRRQHVVSSEKGEVACKKVERRLRRRNRRMYSNFPSEPLTMATGWSNWSSSLAGDGRDWERVPSVCWTTSNTSGGTVSATNVPTLSNISEIMFATATAPGWLNESSMSRLSVPRIADMHASSPLPIGSVRESMSAASLFTTNALTQCPSKRMERSGCLHMWSVISGLEEVTETKDGKGTLFPSWLNARPKCHRPFRHIRRQHVRTSSLRCDVGRDRKSTR